MKNHGMNIEIKRGQGLATSLLDIQLIKYDRDMQPVDSGFNISVTDSRIEKGLFELEYKIMQYADLIPMNGLSTVLDALRRHKISLPPHDDLRKEIVMNTHIIRIGYMGTDTISQEELFGGFLLLRDEIIVSSEPQTRIGSVLDKLEDAWFARKREKQRRGIGELMLKLRNSPPSS